MTDHRGYEMALSEADARRDAMHKEISALRAQNVDLTASLSAARFFVASQPPSAFQRRTLKHIDARGRVMSFYEDEIETRTRSLASERDALRAENAKLGAALAALVERLDENKPVYGELDRARTVLAAVGHTQGGGR